MQSWAPKLYEYLDYRVFLGDYYKAAKVNLPAFSYRYFSQKAGYRSPVFLKLVIDGQRNLSARGVEGFSKALKLTGDERVFFRDLVAFNQASTPEEKNEAFERLEANRNFRKARRLDRSYFKYFSNWYYPAVREMVTQPDFKDDPAWIADHLVPPISTRQASDCLKDLLEIGLLERDADGQLIFGAGRIVATGHEIPRSLLHLGAGNFHRQMLAQAADSITRTDSSRRHLNSITVCISPELVDEFKQRINQFIETLLTLSKNDEDPGTVHQVHVSLFPLTREDDNEA